MIKDRKKWLMLIAAPLLALLIVFFSPSFGVETDLALADGRQGSYDYTFSVPYETLTSGPEGTLVPTQTAYMPASRIAIASESQAGFNSPEDMVVDEEAGRVYVADTGNKRIVVTDLSGNVITTIGEGLLEQPTGLAINGNNLFVCDKTNRLVYIYEFDSGSGEYALVHEIDRPDNPLVGTNTPYVPTKITVDSRGNMYIVSEGCVSGLMQVNMEGEFVGYVGANETTASFISVLQNLFFSEDQKNTFLAAPRSPTNVAIDSRGLVYTVTNNANSNTVKKLNTLGNSIMSPSRNFQTTYAVSIDDSDNIYSVQTDGYITVFDSEGNLLFRFGGTSNDERFGSLSNPVAISALANGRIMVLDKNYNMVITYSRTEFADLVFSAVDYYKDGLYLEGEDLWNEVLRYNSNFILAYKALARASMRRGDYDTALLQFEYAEDRDGYSESYWQIRNDWLEENLVWVFCVIIALIAVVVAVKIINKKKPQVFAPVKKATAKIGDAHIKNVYFFKEVKHIKRFCRSTQDAVYEIKYHDAASVWTAAILFVWFIVLQILSVVVKGYLFNSATVYNTNGWNMVLVTILVFLLLVLCNYFVSTVTDGEGKLKYCFISFVYAISPYLIMALPVFILSNFLTYNESVVYYFCEIVMYGWCAICIFRAIMELHDYSFWKTVKNILLTIFAFAMVLLFAVVLRMLFAQLFGYIGAIFEEVFQ